MYFSCYRAIGNESPVTNIEPATSESLAQIPKKPMKVAKETFELSTSKPFFVNQGANSVALYIDK